MSATVKTCTEHAGDAKQCYYASLRPGDKGWLPVVSPDGSEVTPEEMEAEHPRNAALVAWFEEVL